MTMSDVRVLVGSHLVWVVQLLMIAERTLGGLVHLGEIEEMDEELIKVIEDFDCAVNVEALRLAKEASKQMLETSKQALFSNRRQPNLNRFM